ncbi:hypothetical protein CBR_g30658 [Chara braunii]|uniref:Reverse transcriptase domain-containing protein n=1 Tax=Chara braunii TaxID=69332 RepID=A0A388LDA6_CHABU|nr:hypothetical protein CBR_g30658 [Chara braunii]|eukprot:GBG80291.1 hypothetical protein CBR_g30658 [Chara braunii]
MRTHYTKRRRQRQQSEAQVFAEQVALLAVPESNDDRFQEKLAVAVAALVQLRTLEDLESRATALEQWNQELQAEIVSLKQSQLSAPRPPNPRTVAVPVSHPNTVLMTRASGTVTSPGTGASSSSGGAGRSALVIVPNAGTSAQNAAVLTGVQYNGPVVDKRAATLKSKYNGKGDITSWISSMRSYFKVLRTPQEDRSMIMGTNTEPVVRSFIELEAVIAGYERIEPDRVAESGSFVIAVNSQSDFLSPDEDDPPPEVPTNISHLLDRLPEVLAEPRGVPECPIKHEIEIIEGSVPPKSCVYRMGQGELEELRRQIDDMIDRGWIRPSEFGAPVLFVLKKGGKLRMCINYRGLNRITKKNVYPLPRIDDLLDAASGCKVFSKIDLTSGYHQIEVDPSDQHKTAFKTCDGLYEFVVMPFGLTNAPATFQCLMGKVLRHPLNKFVVVYLDDILIFSKSMEEHVRHLEEVLQVLKEAQLHLNLEKSEFGRDNVIYLGHGLSANGLEPEATKVAVIRKWAQPANVRELRSFLGLASYYPKFVPKFSVIAHPLSRPTSENVAYAWGEKCETVFQALKEALVSHPVLRIADPNLTSVVTTDVSQYGIGVVLQQDDGDGLRPLEYYSKRMPNHKINRTCAFVVKNGPVGGYGKRVLWRQKRQDHMLVVFDDDTIEKIPLDESEGGGRNGGRESGRGDDTAVVANKGGIGQWKKTRRPRSFPAHPGITYRKPWEKMGITREEWQSKMDNRQCLTCGTVGARDNLLSLDSKPKSEQPVGLASTPTESKGLDKGKTPTILSSPSTLKAEDEAEDDSSSARRPEHPDPVLCFVSQDDSLDELGNELVGLRSSWAKKAKSKGELMIADIEIAHTRVGVLLDQDRRGLISQRRQFVIASGNEVFRGAILVLSLRGRFSVLIHVD